VLAEGLGKRYGDAWALRGLDLDVPQGTVLGLLGHNGAGKTTTIRILTTLTSPTEGGAQVAGWDVAANGPRVRRAIGVAGQYATVDGLLSARANLEMVGQLHHLRRKEARRRAEDLLAQVGLSEEADRLVRDFSGGMRRRIDLAASLISDPTVLFLDEPTTGLDPKSRNDLWAMLRNRVSNGMTLVLTTQYLEEADRIADQVVVLDQGRVAASGTPIELKQNIGGQWIDVTVADLGSMQPAADALAGFAEGAIAQNQERKEVSTPIAADTPLLEIVRALDDSGVDALDVRRREATLDEVFLSLTQNQQPDMAVTT
jgi:ABC-2 type transport system ATP-binding protein